MPCRRLGLRPPVCWVDRALPGPLRLPRGPRSKGLAWHFCLAFELHGSSAGVTALHVSVSLLSLLDLGTQGRGCLCLAQNTALRLWKPASPQWCLCESERSGQSLEPRVLHDAFKRQLGGVPGTRSKEESAGLGRGHTTPHECAVAAPDTGRRRKPGRVAARHLCGTQDRPGRASGYASDGEKGLQTELSVPLTIFSKERLEVKPMTTVSRGADGLLFLGKACFSGRRLCPWC